MSESSETLPEEAAAKMRSAVAAQQRGELAAAEKLYRELTGAYPDFPDAWHYLGLLLHQQGKDQVAAPLLAGALALAPDNLVLLVNSGWAFREMGEFERSLECLQRARVLAPDDEHTLYPLAQTLLMLQRGGEIAPDLARHLDQGCEDWKAWRLLGQCREQDRDWSGAIGAYTEACRLAPPGEAAARIARGMAACKNGHYREGEKDFHAALEADPESIEARLGLADLAGQNGDFARAEQLLRQALARDPDQYSAWTQLSSIHPSTPDESLVAELEAAQARAEGRPEAWRLDFALGRVRERLGDYDAAFAAYAHGNQSQVHAPYDREGRLAYTADIIENLDREFVARDIGAAAASGPTPIFVCGMPRSGTTLVETILASHPDVSAGGEQRHMHDRLQQMLDAETGYPGGQLRALPDETLGDIARGWRESLIDPAAGRARVTDKMPGNFAFLGLVHLVFPSAPIVHVRRDPRDTGFSCFATALPEAHNFATLESIGHFYRLYECLMAHWRRTLGDDRIIEVEYEKLVGSPESEIRRLLAVLGLDWDPRCLDFHRTPRNVNTASVWQVRQPLYSTSIGRWRRFERHLGPLMAELDAPPPL
ncbi:MAG: tetratricopeptide repeat-containing sulfotransferase family protein [Gammaproteobacteria bacterium]